VQGKYFTACPEPRRSDGVDGENKKQKKYVFIINQWQITLAVGTPLRGYAGKHIIVLCTAGLQSRSS